MFPKRAEVRGDLNENQKGAPVESTGNAARLKEMGLLFRRFLQSVEEGIVERKKEK